MRKLGIVLVTAGLLSATGCATVVTSADTWPEPNFYGGTADDYKALTVDDHAEDLPVFAFLDLPLSFVLDTALLPVNLLFWLGQALFGADEPEPRVAPASR